MNERVPGTMGGGADPSSLLIGGLRNRIGTEAVVNFWH